jgi:hypothetical protein
MIGLVALNLVLRVIRAGVMDIAFIGHILGVHPHYPAGDPACLGIPAHVIADLEHSRHDASHPEAWFGLSVRSRVIARNLDDEPFHEGAWWRVTLSLSL